MTQRARVLSLQILSVLVVLAAWEAVAVAAAEKPGWRWDRVLAIWLDGVRAPGVTALPPLEPEQAQRRRAP